MIDARSSSKGCGHFFTQKKMKALRLHLLQTKIRLKSLQQVARKQQAVAYKHGDHAIERRNERNQMKRYDHPQNKDDERRPKRKLLRRVESHNPFPPFIIRNRGTIDANFFFV